MRFKQPLLVLSLVSAIALAGVSSSVAANNSQQSGLVNVSTGDVALLNNVNLGVAANVIANVCNVTVPIAVLATQIVGPAGATFCSGTTAPITITQSQPGGGPGGNMLGGGNNSEQTGLINASLGDVAVLNNLNLGVAANLLLNVCNVRIPVAIAAVQAVADGATYTCTSAAGPITLDQAQ
jgi:hypothetical protein